MTYLTNHGIGNILFWLGLGGLAIPLLCYALRWILQELGIFPPTEPVEPSPEPAHIDKLQAIEGIGPQIAGILAAAGLTTFDAVAQKSPGDIRKILDAAGPRYQLANPATWPEQARLLADDDIEGFLRLVIKLTAGVTILENINGIGEARGEKLRLAGINTVAKLADASEDEVWRAVEPTGVAQDDPEIARWIEQARQFADGDSGALADLAGNMRAATLPAAATAVLSRQAANEAEPATAMSGSEAPPARTSGFLRDPAVLCTLTLGVLLMLSSALVGCETKIPKPDQAKYFERECTLKGSKNFLAGPFFVKGKPILTKDGEAEVSRYADELKANTQGNLPDRIFVIGYASDEGKPRYNQILSEQRAEAIKRLLMASESGWPASLFRSAGRGASEAKPCNKEATPGAQESCREPDRRVEVLVAYNSPKEGTALPNCTVWKEVPVPPTGSPK